MGCDDVAGATDAEHFKIFHTRWNANFQIIAKLLDRFGTGFRIIVNELR